MPRIHSVNRSMVYRPEIDGLRAIAVVSVMLFHAGFAWCSGGYVGVDIFFVISGYLITSIIINERENGRFSFVAFYERRVRRILPSLFTVLLACLLPAWLWMTPDQLVDFSKSLVAVNLFVPNVYFWQSDGYFSPAAETIPLIHAWSLGVEEQYYVVFPLLMAIVWRLGRLGMLATFFAISVFSRGQSDAHRET